MDKWNRNHDKLVRRSGKSIITAFSHPTFIRFENNKYLVMACIRGYMDFRDGANSYKIVGCITSNLKDLRKLDYVEYINNQDVEQNISSMQAYPSLFRMNGSVYCCINGNGFGRSGFGIARVRIS